MKRILKYFVFIILVTVALIGRIDVSDYKISESICNEIVSENEPFVSNSLVHISNIYLVSTLPNTSILRLPSSPRRAYKVHKDYSYFPKLTKTINISLGKSIHNEYLILYSHFTNSTHLLISFGKLII